MIRLFKLSSMLILLALVMFGCSSDPGPVQSNFSAANRGYIVPFGATITSATLHMYCSVPSNNSVDIHRATAPWDEGTVTWNSFGEAFAPGIYASFPTTEGWHTADITTLVQEWDAGTYPNYGLVLDQAVVVYPWTWYTSRESSEYTPYLELCYSMNGADFCTNIPFSADAYIWELDPDVNFGFHTYLISGWHTETSLEKQVLISFGFAPPEPCAIGDFVWFDDNNNGIQDEGELGVPGVTVNLYNCDDELIGTMLTDADGYYLFDNLQPGNYYVEFIKPEGYDFSPQDQGADDGVDSDADVLTGRTACTNLEPGETDLTWDAGIHLMEFEGCSLTIGFWKTHAGFGPQADVVTPLLPIWLGTPGGANSIQVTTAAIAHDILVQKTYGDPSNGLTKLYAQLLGAKLNFANGASDGAIAGAVDDADEIIAEHSWTEWDSLSKGLKKAILKLQAKFDDYNNGLIGPGHCD